jgi:hypothetical protein
MDLDRELKSALRRREPPPGFAERVMARTAAEGRDKPAGWREWLFRPFAVRWALASGLAGILVFAGVTEYQRRQGEIAKARVVLALHIAGAKLNYAQRKVQEITLPAEVLRNEKIEDKQ